MFADKYERLLARRGLIQGATEHGVHPEAEVTEETVGFERVHDLEAIQSSISGLDSKLKRLVHLGHVGVACCVVIAVFVVVAVVRMLLQ